MSWCDFFFFVYKQKTAYDMRISDWSSDVCSSDLFGEEHRGADDGAAERESAEKIATFDHAGDTYDAAAGLQARVNISRFAPAARGSRGRSRRGRARSEERRGGKECGSTSRARWARDHYKKKN